MEKSTATTKAAKKAEEKAKKAADKAAKKAAKEAGKKAADAVETKPEKPAPAKESRAVEILHGPSLLADGHARVKGEIVEDPGPQLLEFAEGKRKVRGQKAARFV